MRISPTIAAASALFCLVGCPSTTPTQPSIDEVVAVTPIVAPSFDLRITGHGFGLRDVSFDLSSGTGAASLYKSRIRILNQMGGAPAEVRIVTATVTSPTELHATVYLFGPLPRGEYGIELYVQDEGEPVATRVPAFLVGAALSPADAGPIPPGADATPRPDATPPDLDGGTADDPDAADGVDVTLVDPPDTGGFFDATVIDSGLGPFPPGPNFRRVITLANDTGLPSPVDITVRVPVPHATLLAAGQTRPDGADLAVYLGPTLLPHQIEDLALLGTDRLELVVRLPVAAPPGVSAGLLLALYSDPGIPSAAPPTDAVYVFAEHFGAALQSDANDPNQYNDRWEQRCADRITGAANGSKCRSDIENGQTKRTIATPRVLAMSNTPPMNEVYEVVGYIAGAMQTQNDIVYFAYGADNVSFDQTTQLPELAFDPAFRPNATLTFVETNNANRTVSGWRLPPAGVPFTRMRVSFVPQIRAPNLHFRFISNDGQVNANTQVLLDDLVVRRALNPDFRVTLGPAETR